MRHDKIAKTTITALAIIGLGWISTAGAAAPSYIEEGKLSVSVTGIDLDTTAGARILYARLQAASRHACNYESVTELGSVRRHRQAATCYEQALDSAVESIGNDALTAIHAG